ncbi:hypothetical protein BGZ79_003259 [Entomortierella chlamydospora]|nr:hypothetical protein BGZ79_003259 [Entomortierella chlamydospora]
MSWASIEILSRNLVHIRFADSFPTKLLTTHLPSLTDLTIRNGEAHGSGTEAGNLELIKNNPQLQKLHWTGFLPLSPIVPWPFLSLTRLTDLTLDRWHSEDGGFVKVLMAISKTLTRLSLLRISGVDRSSFENLYLPHLIDLRTYLYCVGSVGFEYLVCCCPNLEKLEHILELIRSCRTLVSFEYEVTGISKPLTEALLQHRSTLKSLRLGLQRGKQLAIEGLVDILQSFTELEELHITGYNFTTDAILLDGLFQQPWACLNLKVFRISAYRLTLPQENENKSLSSLSGKCAVFGWYLHRPGDFAMRLTSKLLWVLFQHVQNLTKLQEIY